MARSSSLAVLCDTGIFIQALRGSQTMLDELDSLGTKRIAYSAITKAELYYGVKKKEVTNTKILLNRFKYFPIDPAITDLFVQMMYEYRDQNPQVTDCFIAATALTYDLQLFTLNRTHFSYYHDLRLFNPTYLHS